MNDGTENSSQGQQTAITEDPRDDHKHTLVGASDAKVTLSDALQVSFLTDPAVFGMAHFPQSNMANLLLSNVPPATARTEDNQNGEGLSSLLLGKPTTSEGGPPPTFLLYTDHDKQHCNRGNERRFS